MRLAVLLIAAGLVAAPAVALAQEEAPKVDCSTGSHPLPAEFAGWASPTPLDSAGRGAGLPQAEVKVGSAVKAQLHKTPEVSYVVLPEKPGGTVSHGGMFLLNIDQPGTYAIGLSSGAWIDVLNGKTVVDSVAHGRGPACTGIHKMVDFALKPGRYVIQISANADPEIILAVARRP